MTQTIDFKKAMQVNRATIVGAVTAIDMVDDFNKAQKPVKRGTLTVKVGESELLLQFYFAETYNNGNANASYNIMNEMAIGSVFSFDCSLEENRFAPRDGSGEIAKSYRLRINFINKLRQGDTEGAGFEFGGVVLSPLKEVVKDDEIVRYDIIIGQPKYRVEEGFNSFRFNVDPRNTQLVDAVRDNFKPMDTVKINGHIVNEVVITEVTEEALFGEDIVKTYQNSFTFYNIAGASRVSEDNIYSEEQINHLIANTKSNDAKMLTAATKPAAATNTAKSNADLLGDFFG